METNEMKSERGNKNFATWRIEVRGCEILVPLRLAIQTVHGSVLMARDTQQHIAELRDAVTSPGGTTIAGLHALEEGAFRAIVMDAISSATERSLALGRGEP